MEHMSVNEREPTDSLIAAQKSTIIATTQPTTQNNFCWGGIIIGKKPTTGYHYNLGSSRQPRELIFGMQPYFNPNR